MDVLSQQNAEAERNLQENGRTIFLASKTVFHSKDDFCRYLDHTFGKYKHTYGNYSTSELFWDAIAQGLPDQELDTSVAMINNNKELNSNFVRAVKKEMEARAEKLLLKDSNEDDI